MFAKHRDLLEIILLFFGSLILFTWGLNSQEIITFDSRFYLFAQEMWQNGPSWFPTTYDSPYPDYPATSTWLIYLLAKVAGGVNKLIAVLPSAILASLTIIFTYLIGALHSKRYGLCAVFFLLLTLSFIKSARSISLDLYPTFITTVCFYLIYSADKKAMPSRARWVYLFLFFGFIVRGPIGLVLPAGVICSYYLLNRQIKQFFFFGFLAFVLLLIFTGLLLGLAYFVGGDSFLINVLRMEVLGRIDNYFLPIYFYFTDSFGSYALAFPFATLVLLTMCFKRTAVETAFLVKLLGWMLVILIGMSIPGDKKVRYILPMLPAATLIAAYPWLKEDKQNYLSFLRKIAVGIFLLLPLFCLLITIVVYFYAEQHGLPFESSYAYAIAGFIFIQLISIVIFYSWSIQNKARDVLVIGLAALSFAMSYLLVIEPIELYFERARDFVIKVETERLQHHARLIFYHEKPDNLPIKYLINMPQPAQPEFIYYLPGLMALTAPAFIITSEVYFNELPKKLTAQFDIVAKNNLGHVPVVVFTKKGII